MRNFIEGFKEQFKQFWEIVLPIDSREAGEMVAFFICMFSLILFVSFLVGSILGSILFLLK